MYKIGNEGSSLKRQALNFLPYGVPSIWGCLSYEMFAIWDVCHMGAWGGLVKALLRGTLSLFGFCFW